MGSVYLGQDRLTGQQVAVKMLRSAMADDPQAVLAAGHESGQVDRPDLKILRNRDRLLIDGCCQNPGYDYVFVGLKNVRHA